MITRRMWRGVLWGLMVAVAAWGVYLTVPGFLDEPQPQEVEGVADGGVMESQDLWEMAHRHQAQPALAPAASADREAGSVDPRTVSGLPYADDGGLDLASRAGARLPPGMGSIYDEYRMERQRLRDQRLEVIQRMSEAADVTQEQRWESHRMMLDLLALQAREIELEYLLKARGYEEAIVSLQGDFANVVLPGILTERDAARIGELVARMAGVPMDRIAIVDGYEIP